MHAMGGLSGPDRATMLSLLSGRPPFPPGAGSLGLGDAEKSAFLASLVLLGPEARAALLRLVAEMEAAKEGDGGAFVRAYLRLQPPKGLLQALVSDMTPLDDETRQLWLAVMQLEGACVLRAPVACVASCRVKAKPGQAAAVKHLTRQDKRASQRPPGRGSARTRVAPTRANPQPNPRQPNPRTARAVARCGCGAALMLRRTRTMRTVLVRAYRSRFPPPSPPPSPAPVQATWASARTCRSCAR
jgi:hypothetical protein